MLESDLLQVLQQSPELGLSGHWDLMLIPKLKIYSNNNFSYPSQQPMEVSPLGLCNDAPICRQIYRCSGGISPWSPCILTAICFMESGWVSPLTNMDIRSNWPLMLSPGCHNISRNNRKMEDINDHYNIELEGFLFYITIPGLFYYAVQSFLQRGLFL